MRPNTHVVWLDARHSCPGCGCEYRHRFKVEVNAKDEAAALKRARQQTEDKGLRDVPCPECGRIAVANVSHQPPSFIILLIVGGWSLAVIFAFTPILAPLDLWATVAASVAAVGIAIVHSGWFIVSRNPPSAARRRKARDLVARDRIHSIRPNATAPASSTRGRRVRHAVPWLGSALLLAAGIGLPLASGGYNPDVRPRFVAPGSEVQHYFDGSPRSINGLWRGQPRIEAWTMPDRTPVLLTGTSHDDKWGSTIDVEKNKELRTFYPETRFTLPADPELVGRTIEMKITMTVSYPNDISGPGGVNTFMTVSSKFESRFELRVSSAEEVRLVQAVWWIASAFAMACLASPLVRLLRFRPDDPNWDLQPGTPPVAACIPIEPAQNANGEREACNPN